MTALRWFCLGAVVLGAVGCAASNWTLDLSNLNTGQAPGVIATIQYPDWTEVQPGVYFKQLLVGVETKQELLDIVRIDQTAAHVQVAVDEGTPKTISAWAEVLPASVIVNGSYFDEQYQLITRTVVAGQVEGKLLSGETGLLQQDASGQWSISRWQGGDITASTAVQSYPLLLNDGVAFTGGSVQTAQRSVIAQAADGQLYIIVSEYGVWSLQDIAAALAFDLEIDFTMALNLDGGTSTGLVVQSDTVHYLDESLLVPAVLYISTADTL